MNGLYVKRLLKISLLAGVASCTTLGAQIALADDNLMLDACIHEFIANNLSGYQGNVSVHKSVNVPSVPLAAGHRSEVVVSAARAHGSEIASAICRVNREGKVTSLTLMSGGEKLATVATPAISPVVADTQGVR